MVNHSYKFAGGDVLSKIDAVWFVSYAYYKCVDEKHLNWTRTSTCNERCVLYEHNAGLCRLWLAEILKMSGSKLRTNPFGLSARKTRRMARKTLARMFGRGVFRPCCFVSFVL